MKNSKWADKFCIRSASNDCDFRWYEYQDNKTLPYDFDYEPKAWEVVSNLLVPTKPCLAIVSLNQELSCIFTGLLSERKTGSRLIYDTVIVANSNDELSDLQKKLLNVFLSAEINHSPLNSLSKAFKDNGIDGIIIDEEIFKNELEELYNRGSKTSIESKYLFPDCVVKDSLVARYSLAKELAKTLPNNSESQILSVVTKHKSPELLKNKVILGITDYSTAPQIEDVATVITQKQPDKQQRFDIATETSRGEHLKRETVVQADTKDERTQAREAWQRIREIPFWSWRLVIEKRIKQSDS